MSDNPSQHPLATWIDSKNALAADTNLSHEAKQTRDREIGKANTDRTKHQQIGNWLNTIQIPGFQRQGHQWVHGYHSLLLLTALIGLVSGLAWAKLVLAYDGGQPINIIQAWMLLVGLPVLFWLFYVLSLLPIKIPLFASLGQLFQRSLFYPIVRSLMRRFSGDHKSSAPINAADFSQVGFSMALFLTQLLGLAFAVGTIIASVYLISTRDLAFAWSTTLDLDSQTLHSITSALSAPFAKLSDLSKPSLELIEASRYFRLDDATLSHFQKSDIAQILTAWWPFLLACMLVYTLGLRLLSTWHAHHRFISLSKQAIINQRGAGELLSRLNSPLVSTLAPTEEVALDTNLEQSAQPKRERYQLNAAVIDWSDSGLDKATAKIALKTIGIRQTDFKSLGGRLSLAQDQATIGRLTSRKPESIAIITKAWDTPTLDFHDAISSIRQHFAGKLIVLLQHNTDTPATREDIDSWRQSLANLNDTALTIDELITA